MIARFEKPVQAWAWVGAMLVAGLTAVGITGAAEQKQPAQPSKAAAARDDSKPAISKAKNQGTLSGRVVDESGQPIGGARIWANTDEEGNRIEANSDSGGRFRLGPIEPFYRLRYDLIIDADGFARSYIAGRNCTIFPRRDSDLGTIQLDRGRTFTGQVLDVDGTPVPNAIVDCSMYRHVMGHSTSDIGPKEVLTTDDQGRFRTPAITVGKLYLLVRVPERKWTFVGRHVEPGGEETIEAIRLERDTPIQGAIHDEQGAPIAGAAIIANADGDKTTSDAEGKFTLRGFGTRDHFQLQVRKDGYVFVDRGVNVKEDGLRWHTVGGDGKTYTLDVPFQDTAWYVVTEEPGHAPTQVGPVSIIVNQERELDVACTEGGSISGWVKGAPRGWQGFLWVVAFSKTGIRAETRVAPNGEFSLQGLPAGEYGVKVGHDAFDDAEVPQGTVPPEDWERPADPWKRAAVITVRAGEDSAEFELEPPNP